MSNPNSHNRVPTNPYNDKYSSLIRPIKIFLPRRKANLKDEDVYDDFVGREQLMERLFNWLSNKKKESGSYLITGFRGMGKTTLVNRVTKRLTREIQQKTEPWWGLFVIIPLIITGLSFFFECNSYKWLFIALCLYLILSIGLSIIIKHWYVLKKMHARRQYPNHSKFEDLHVDRMARGKRDDQDKRDFRNIKVSINLGHEVLQERHILGLITTNVRDEYRQFVKSFMPHIFPKTLLVVIVALLSFGFLHLVENVVAVNELKKHSDTTIIYEGAEKDLPLYVIKDAHEDSWFSRTVYNIAHTVWKVYSGQTDIDRQHRKGDNTDNRDTIQWIRALTHFMLFILVSMFFWWFLTKFFRMIPYFSAPQRALKRLETLAERIVATTDIETGGSASLEKSILSLSLFNRRKRKTIPIADIREIETELADIINQVKEDSPRSYQANFIVVFDEMDKIDPAMMEKPNNDMMPEFTDSVKGFPDGMDSRERRRNVLKLLANIKLFVSTAKAKFVFISGRELYDAYLADLSDRDFAISSIFSGVINVDSFLTPEGGQTDVRSMSEWYIANRLLPLEWLQKKERKNAEGKQDKKGHTDDNRAVLKPEMPSLRWYYEYLLSDECNNNPQDAAYVIGFLHTFAAYLTHISNGSPKKIFLYFDKYLRRAEECLPINNWGDICTVGKPMMDKKEGQKVLFFEPIQQRVINFVHYLSNPIMGTITNDMSSYGDRFLVSLSFIIDHIYKHHNRSFSWRNLEQIPDLLKTSKAPELRDEVMSIMEYLSQIHISPILIGLNEYKFHKSIAEEISVISKMSDEASAIFNFTLDESLSVIQHNTRLLNHYIELERKQLNDNSTSTDNRRYQSIIARIHSNLGDLHYWDEDYYAASMEYRAAIDALPERKSIEDEEADSGFITRARCMLKLGLTYEFRKLYPNAYQTYCRLIEQLIKSRWVNEDTYGLSVIDGRTDGWQDKRQVMVFPKEDFLYSLPQSKKESRYNKQFRREIFEGEYSQPGNVKTSYSANFDGIISTFASDLTAEKSQTINKLTLFEEIRYLYQSILAKLSILENLGMSGITQTNIKVAEGEFMTLHKSVNHKEKFIIAADFFRKLAEILYYKNSLTIISQNQDSFYASVYYDDHDLLFNLDDFCMRKDVNALVAKHDILYFFNELNNSSVEKQPRFSYPNTSDGKFSLQSLYQNLYDNIDDYLVTKEDEDKNRIATNVRAYFKYNIDEVFPNRKDVFYYGSVESCEYHCKLLRQQGLRTPCYACKYYTRSLRILAENMFVEKERVLSNALTKSYGILTNSFKNKLLYTNSANILALAQTLEGFGNVMYACASGDDYEGEHHRPGRGITPGVIEMLLELCEQMDEDSEIRVMYEHEKQLSRHRPLSRLDKSILYYWDAYRFYLMDASYNEAVGCLQKILNIIVYYLEVVYYYGNSDKLRWNEESNTIIALIGHHNSKKSFLGTLFQLVTRHTSYKYDLANLNEINELKWMFSKEIRDDIDLTRLSIYPDIRSTWLRVVEVRAKGLRFLAKKGAYGYSQEDYMDFITRTYPLITPHRRYQTTFYEEVLGYYTKMRFNDHIMNNLLGGNPMIVRNEGDYSTSYHVVFYEKLYDFLNSSAKESRLDYTLFEIKQKDADKRLQLMEYLIHDTLVCITNMVNVFTPHNHLTSYSKSFVGIVYNFYWEWSRKYEFLHSLYEYSELMRKGNCHEMDRIVNNIWNSGSIQNDGASEELCIRLKMAMDKCAKLVPIEKDDSVGKFGFRSDRLYEMLRHNIDDITINTIYSNYTAEMALKYYQMAEEANTEGEAYRELMGSLRFLNDDLNNDTCQFNIACDRFLLNCGVVSEQRRRLERLYKHSNVYNLNKAYIEGPNRLREESADEGQFERSQYINSEY